MAKDWNEFRCFICIAAPRLHVRNDSNLIQSFGHPTVGRVLRKFRHRQPLRQCPPSANGWSNWDDPSARKTRFISARAEMVPSPAGRRLFATPSDETKSSLVVSTAEEDGVVAGYPPFPCCLSAVAKGHLSRRALGLPACM